MIPLMISNPYEAEWMKIQWVLVYNIVEEIQDLFAVLQLPPLEVFCLNSVLFTLGAVAGMFDISFPIHSQ